MTGQANSIPDEVRPTDDANGDIYAILDQRATGDSRSNHEKTVKRCDQDDQNAKCLGCDICVHLHASIKCCGDGTVFEPFMQNAWVRATTSAGPVRRDVLSVYHRPTIVSTWVPHCGHSIRKSSTPWPVISMTLLTGLPKRSSSASSMLFTYTWY